jgi:hypothetical protein
MKKLGDFKCPECNWVHGGIAEADAVAAVAEFNQHLATLSLEAQAKFGGEQSLEMYRRCFRCGAPSDTFVPAAPGDAPLGCTLQAVIAPVELRGE